MDRRDARTSAVAHHLRRRIGRGVIAGRVVRDDRRVERRAPRRCDRAPGRQGGDRRSVGPFAVEIDVDQDGTHGLPTLAPAPPQVNNSLLFSGFAGAGARAAAIDDIEHPVVPGAHELLALDEAIRNSPAIVRTFVVDDDQPAALQPGHRDRPGTVPRPDNRADRHEPEDPDVPDVRRPVVRVVSELVEELGVQRHAPNVRDGSDYPAEAP